MAHFTAELRSTATSLDLEAGHAIDRAAVARSVLERLEVWLGRVAEGPSGAGAGWQEALAATWRRHSGDMGERVTLTADGRTYCGRILDVHPTDGLLLQLEEGGRRHFDPASTSRAS